MNDLVFVGFNSRVAALDRRTGNLAWDWRAPKGRGYVTVLLDGDLLAVSVNGYQYGLEAATGRELWFNSMSGFGFGVASLASVRGGHSSTAVLQASAQQEEQAQSSGHAPT
ncbi:MAG: PQQ-binding-like beta-propeller repeat protein [Planctomycetota bacterium]